MSKSLLPPAHSPPPPKNLVHSPHPLTRGPFMCGIVAYVGKKNAQSLLLEGLKRLEYRGYDSAGICIGHTGKLHVRRAVGRVSVLESALEAAATQLPAGQIGMAHT